MTRIQALVDAVPPSARVVDVGADHGLISLGLAKRSDIGAILATDISGDSLSKLAKALPQEAAGVQQKIHMTVTDGLQKLPWPSADTIVIAGMGGPLIERILRDSLPFAKRAKTWVLSPQSGLPDFRRFLQRLAMPVEEDLVEEAGIFYPLFRVFPGCQRSPQSDYAEALSDTEAEYGPTLLRQHHPVLMEQLHREQKTLSGLIQKLAGQGSPTAKKRRQELENQCAAIRSILKEQAEHSCDEK